MDEETSALVGRSTEPVELTAFVAEHGLTLTRFAYLLCGDRGRAEDLVQETFLAMHRRFGAEVHVDNPLAYARRVIVNANVSWSRRRWTRDVLVDELPVVGVRDRDRLVDEELWRALASLPARQRTVLVLRYFVGHSDAEIAEALDVRRGTVRSLASRALTHLRVSVDPRAYDLTEGSSS